MLTIWSFTSGTLCQRKMLNPGETGYLSVDTGFARPLGSWVRAERRSWVTGNGECSCKDCSLQWISCLTY